MKHPQKKHLLPLKEERGYILLEMVIALAVIGVMMGAAIPIYTTYIEKQKFQTTRARMEQVKAHLQNYYNLYKKYPCPADMKEKGSKFGEEASRGEVSVAEKTCIPLGVLPFITLGIAPDEARDAYGHYFTYAVGENIKSGRFETLSFNAILNAQPFVGAAFAQERFGAGQSLPSPKTFLTIDVHDRGRVVTYGGGDSFPVPYVLVSHGPHGCGSFQENGERFKACAPFGDDEKTNAGEGSRYVSRPWNEQGGRDHFSNIVVFGSYSA